MKPARPAVWLVLLATVAVACRLVVAWPLVFPHPGEVRFFEADPWFHVRQVHATVAQYPVLNRWDRGTHYPTGERGMNQGLFDWGMATVAMALGAGHPSPHLVDLVAAWTPVVLSLVLLGTVYGTARCVMAMPSAILAVALLVLTPGSLATYSMLGYSDHHILEDILRVAMLGTLLRAWTRAPGWSSAFVAALPAVLFLYSWPGASLDVAIAGLAVVVAGTVTAVLGDDVGPLMGFSFRYGLTLLVLYFSVAWVCPDAVMWDRSKAFILLGSSGIALLVPLWLQAARWLRTGRRLAGLAVLGILGLAGAWGANSPSGRWALDLLFAPRSPLVAEQQPATLQTFLLDYGLVGILALYGVLILVRGIRRRDRSPAVVLLLVFGCAWLGLWAHTYDFIYAPPPFVALLAAAATVDWRPSAALCLGLAAVQAILCCLGVTAWPWPSPAMARALMIVDDDWMSALTWLRTETPPVPRLTGLGPFSDPVYPPGSYGVFTAWDDGEYVAGPGGRPCLWSEDMTPDYARWLMTTDEPEASHLLAGWAAPGQSVRYVVLDSRMGTEYLAAELSLLGRPFKAYFQPGPAVPEGIIPEPGPLLQSTMWAQLYRHDGRSLSHFRLVYETPGQVVAVWVAVFEAGGCRVVGQTTRLADRPDMARLTPETVVSAGPGHYLFGPVQTSAVKIFEAVPGAHLMGRTSPARGVSASLELRCRSTGRMFSYQAQGQSDATTGAFDIVVPYPTAADSASDVVATGDYRVDSPFGARTVTVSTNAVETGAQVRISP